MAEVFALLPPTTSFTAEQALSWALQRELTDVLIGGYDAKGKFVATSSKMTREQALWLAKHLEMHSLGQLD